MRIAGPRKALYEKTFEQRTEEVKRRHGMLGKMVYRLGEQQMQN